MNQLTCSTRSPKVLVVKRQNNLFLLADLSALLVLWYWLVTWLDLASALVDLVSATLTLLTYRLDVWLTVAGVVGRAVVWAIT